MPVKRLLKKMREASQARKQRRKENKEMGKTSAKKLKKHEKNIHELHKEAVKHDATAKSQSLKAQKLKEKMKGVAKKARADTRALKAPKYNVYFAPGALTEYQSNLMNKFQKRIDKVDAKGVKRWEKKVGSLMKTTGKRELAKAKSKAHRSLSQQAWELLPSLERARQADQRSFKGSTEFKKALKYRHPDSQRQKLPKGHKARRENIGNAKMPGFDAPSIGRKKGQTSKKVRDQTLGPMDRNPSPAMTGWLRSPRYKTKMAREELARQDKKASVINAETTKLRKDVNSLTKHKKDLTQQIAKARRKGDTAKVDQLTRARTGMESDIKQMRSKVKTLQGELKEVNKAKQYLKRRV